MATLARDAVLRRAGSRCPASRASWASTAGPRDYAAAIPSLLRRRGRRRAHVPPTSTSRAARPAAVWPRSPRRRGSSRSPSSPPWWRETATCP
jgi:hypothetical protein